MLRFQIAPRELRQIPAEARLELGKNRSKLEMASKRQRDESLRVVWRRAVYQENKMYTGLFCLQGCCLPS